MSEFKTMTKMKTDEPSVLTKAKRNVSTTKMASTNLTTGYKMFKDGGSVTSCTTTNQTSGYKYFKDGGKVMKAEGGAMGALSDMAAMKMADKRKAKKAPMSGGMHKMPDGKMMKNSAMKMASGGQITDREEKIVTDKERQMDKKVHKHEGTLHPGKPLTKLKAGGKAAYKDGGEVEKKAMGGGMPMRMGQKPAQTIRTAPIGSSQATRDLFASKGKKAPSAPVRINQLAGTFKNGGKAGC